MAVTIHQQFHLDALKRDATNIIDSVERQRVLDDVADLETQRVAWPISVRSGDLTAGYIHDYIEIGDRSG